MLNYTFYYYFGEKNNTELEIFKINILKLEFFIYIFYICYEISILWINF